MSVAKLEHKTSTLNTTDVLPWSEPVSPVYFIERPPLSPKEAESSASQMADVARRLLQVEYDAMEAENERIELDSALYAERSTLALPEHFGRFAKSEQSNFLRKASKFEVLLELKTDARLLSPPYELGWQEGAGLGGKLDGKMITFVSRGFSAGGIGLQLSSPERVFASVAFAGHFDFNWVSFDHYPSLSSSGGLGVCVYRSAEPTPILVRRATLWNVRSPLRFTSDTGAGTLSNVNVAAPGPSAMTFAFRLVPVDLLMEPDTTYRVWLWNWQVASVPEGAAFLAFLSCKVPLIMITTGQPSFPQLH
jgi:hypothetical protein